VQQKGGFKRKGGWDSKGKDDFFSEVSNSCLLVLERSKTKLGFLFSNSAVAMRE